MLMQIMVDIYQSIVLAFINFLSRVRIFFTFRSRTPVYFSLKILNTVIFSAPMLAVALIEFVACALVYIIGKTLSTFFSRLPILSIPLSFILGLVFLVVSKAFDFLHLIMLLPDFVLLSKSFDSNDDDDYYEDNDYEELSDDIPVLYNKPSIQ